MPRIITLAILFAFLSSCGGPKKLVVRPHYLYINNGSNVYDVLVTGDQALQDFLAEMKCGPCAQELKGFYYVVITPRKD